MATAPSTLTKSADWQRAAGWDRGRAVQVVPVVPAEDREARHAGPEADHNPSDCDFLNTNVPLVIYTTKEALAIKPPHA